jgi:signal peptidase I
MTSEKKNLATEVAEVPAETWLQKAWNSQRENLQIIIIALGLAIVIRALVAEPRFIPSDSMIPTLHVGDRVVV